MPIFNVHGSRRVPARAKIARPCMLCGDVGAGISSARFKGAVVLSLRGEQLAQYVRQNTAVLVIVDFGRGVDAQKQAYLPRRAVFTVYG